MRVLMWIRSRLLGRRFSLYRHDMTGNTKEEPVKLPATSKRVLIAATIFSGLWLMGSGLIAWTFHCGVHAPIKINEWGDYAAGVSAPIAFIWLVVAVFLQSAELREQRRELALTRGEVKDSRAVMQAQADHMLKQTDLLKANRSDAEHEQVFDDAVERIATRLRQYVSSAWNIYYRADWENKFEPGTKLMQLRAADYKDEDDILVIASTVQALRTDLRSIKTKNPHPELVAEYAYDFQRVYRAVTYGVEKINSLPARYREKASTLELDELKQHMDFIGDRAGVKPFEPVTQVSKN